MLTQKVFQRAPEKSTFVIRGFRGDYRLPVRGEGVWSAPDFSDGSQV